MNIHFEPLIVDEEIIECLVRWYNDEEIAPFIHPNFQSQPPSAFTREDALAACAEYPDKYNYLIFDDLTPIGELSITRNFFMLHANLPDSAWISICIGEKAYWGKGIARMAMTFLENECRKMGCTRIELGVFENNIRAYHRYLSLGYREIARYPDFTYSKGRWVADIRMEKNLLPFETGQEAKEDTHVE
ncbi:MAG: GNAT family protein [Erysipelotrichaceae bacterium]